jgi:myb proto-oncogene protein
MADKTDSEMGRLLLGGLDINSHNPEREEAARSRLKKREISEGAYTNNTPYEPKLQRVNFLGARKPGVVPNMWTTQEDAALQAAVNKHGDKNWRTIAEDIPGRNHLQCLQRWKKALRPGLVKGHWSKAEDARLLDLITAYTEKGTISNINWAAIAQQIDGRNAKQCRERWFLNLDPSINRGPWTAEEDERLLKLAAQCGGRWSLISKNMVGRTENSVKTRYHSLQRQEARSRGWTPEEDQTLLNATLVFGRDWGKVVKQLPGRSRGQLKKRFAVLTQHNPNMVRDVQMVEEQLAKGVIVAPNPPPPPIQPTGAASLHQNLQAQQAGQKPTHAPMVSPYVPSNVPLTQSGGPAVGDNWGQPQQQQQQPRAKGMGRYGSSWMQGGFETMPDLSSVGRVPSQIVNQQNSFMAPVPDFLGSGANSRGAAGTTSGIFEFSAPSDGQEAAGQWGMPPAPQNANAAKKQLAHRNTSNNLALIDKLLGDNNNAPAAGNDAADFLGSMGQEAAPAQQNKQKGMRNYSSWGSIGGGDYGNMFGAGGQQTDTSSGTGVPPMMRTGSDKKLSTKRASSNWGAAPQPLASYETNGGDLKNFLNML